MIVEHDLEDGVKALSFCSYEEAETFISENQIPNTKINKIHYVNKFRYLVILGKLRDTP